MCCIYKQTSKESDNMYIGICKIYEILFQILVQIIYLCDIFCAVWIIF